MSTLWFDHYYVLLEAYERFGMHLYGTSWTHRERHTIAGDVHPDTLKRRIRELETETNKLFQEIETLEERRKGEVQQSEIEEIKSTIETRREKLSPLHEELYEARNKLPLVEEYHDALERREDTQFKLLEALQNGRLMACAYPNTGIPKDYWVNRRGVDSIFDFCTVVLPPTLSSKHRHLVGIKKSELDLWIEGIESIVPSKPKPVEDQALAFLIATIRDDKRLRREKVKEDYCEQLMQRFPKLNKTGFKNVWDRRPDKWKKPGPKKQR